LLAAALLLPLLLAVFAGRMTSFEDAVTAGTGQGRIKGWMVAIGFLRQQPVFGLGQGMFVERTGNAVHNSFLEGFAELGFVGGTLLLGAFYCALRPLLRAGSPEIRVLDPEMEDLRPYLIALLVGYAAGMLTLSRNYIAVTYLVLGLASVYLSLTRPRSDLLGTRLEWRLVRHMVTLNVVFIGAFYLLARLLVRWS
jgi:O-antigen ligase